MDSIHKNREWDCVEEEPAEQSHYLKAPGLCDSSADPKLQPRIGDEYQAKIPTLISKLSYLKLTDFPTDSTILPPTPHSPITGLPIKFSWPAESHSSSNDMLNRNVAALQSCTTNSDMHQPCGVETHLIRSSLDSWIEAEEAAFLLGLYTFGKKFLPVKKFVESKTMEDIHSYYYGKFYGSAQYWRWSERRKMRSRRCIFGQKIYTGLRQRKLLSRLLLHVPEEGKKTLLEVAKTFGEGKMILEEFVFTLKAIVGLNVLVEAVGIGKEGNQDLTGIVKEPSKIKQTPICPNVPKGKACCSLTPLEIVNFLTGGYRLSKARSDDIFWDAVWPRLLAKGWHSEQPSDYLMTANKHSLVFLIPGVKTFSRRKMVKGKHYFDSVADVLNKVASDPALLELCADTGPDKNEENRQINKTSLKKGDLYQQHHNYLKPQSAELETDSIRYTVVDTSLANGGTKKVRDLRSIPVGMKNISAPCSESDESNGDCAKEATNDSGCSHDLRSDMFGSGTSRPTMNNLGKGFLGGLENLQDDASKCCSVTESSSFTSVPVKVQEGQQNGNSQELQPRKNVKSQGFQKINPGSRKFRAPLGHQHQSLNSLGQFVSGCGANDALVRRSFCQEKTPPEQQFQLLVSCGGVVPCYSREETLVSPSLSHEKMPLKRLKAMITGGRLVASHGTKDPLVSPSISSQIVGGRSGKPAFGADLSITEERHMDKFSPTSFSSQVGTDGLNQHPFRSNFPAAESSYQKPRVCALFDLNALPLPEGNEDHETSLMEMQRPHHEIRRQLENSSSRCESLTVCCNSSDQHPDLNWRRHSKRNGPPTAKALEAFAAGFYSTTNERKRKGDFQPLENLMSKSSSHIEETHIFS